MRVHFCFAFILTLLLFPVIGKSQTELLLPLNDDFIRAALNPAAMGQSSPKKATLSFRNQLQYRQTNRSYTGNYFAWETAVGTHVSHQSFWGLQLFSADEPGLNRFKMNALYSYCTPLSEDINIRLGVQMGYDHQSYGKDYVFPDQIGLNSESMLLNSKESLSVAGGSELEWHKWTLGIAIHQLGNRIGSVRSLYTLRYTDNLPLGKEKGKMEAKAGYYHIDNQSLMRVSCALLGEQFGLNIAQTMGLKKSENTSSFGISYQLENIHFQYDIAWSYFTSSSISSTGFRSEFGIIYSFSY